MEQEISARRLQNASLGLMLIALGFAEIQKNREIIFMNYVRLRMHIDIFQM